MISYRGNKTEQCFRVPFISCSMVDGNGEYNELEQSSSMECQQVLFPFYVGFLLVSRKNEKKNHAMNNYNFCILPGYLIRSRTVITYINTYLRHLS